MGCGLATIVGKKSGACPWVAGYGETGLLVDVEDPQDMASAMLKLAIDGELRKSYSKKALHRARAVFSLESVARQYLDAYRSIVPER
jgi:glycosyltransferase involved in cell wall biosynthesis